MKFKTTSAVLAALFIFSGFLTNQAIADTVKMRIVAVNPSQKKPQTAQVKAHLPKEVTLKDIKETGGLEVEYDQEQGSFCVFKNDVELAPSETKTFEIVIDDIWVVQEDQINQLKTKAERLVKELAGSNYAASAETVAKSVNERLDTIVATQTNPNVTRQQHIASFRENLIVVDAVKEDIDKLEKILVAVGGPPNPELIEESDINLKSPSSKTTWILIFVVLIFVAILSATFFFTWHRQANITENIFSREKNDSFSDLKSTTTPEGQEDAEKKA